MAVTDFIVAIELGSAKISGIAGKKLPDGSIQILATASENASDCIRKGVIYNLDKTTQSLTSIIKKLESTLKASIGKVYIGMGGQSLRTIRNTEVRHMDEETKISQELIDSLKDSNRSVPIVGYQILGVAPQEYKVGNDLIVEPVGVQTDHIEARFLNIIARKNVKDNVSKCCDLVPIEIAEDAEDLIAPLALADAVLTSGEKRSGCVLVDFGADTTTVSVYKNNILRHLAVIPLGGNNITRDICSQQIEEEDAEALKIKFAQAYSEPKENEDENKTYNLEGRCSINAILLEDIVEARVNEILDNVAHQIALSGYDNKLLAGAVITGPSCPPSPAVPWCRWPRITWVWKSLSVLLPSPSWVISRRPACAAPQQSSLPWARSWTTARSTPMPASAPRSRSCTRPSPASRWAVWRLPKAGSRSSSNQKGKTADPSAVFFFVISPTL